MREIKESDWKILRRLHTVALERFCGQILLEIERIQGNSTMTFHQKYLKIYDVIRGRDKDIAQTFNGLRRSTAITQLSAMKLRDLLTESEFSQFSEETQGIIGFLLGD